MGQAMTAKLTTAVEELCDLYRRVRSLRSQGAGPSRLRELGLDDIAAAIGERLAEEGGLPLMSLALSAFEDQFDDGIAVNWLSARWNGVGHGDKRWWD